MPEVFEGGHNFVCGMTQSGKTYFVLKNLERSALPCLFFNPQKVKTNFIMADYENSVYEIEKALLRGEKLDYIPSLSLRTMKHELNFIVNYLFKSEAFQEEHLIIAIDECHLLAPEGANNEYIDMIPTRGFAWGFRGVFIAQRPALVDKTIITQSNRHFIFHTEWESAYFRTKGLDMDAVSEKLGNKESDQYNYVIYERGQVTGPHRERG